MNKLKIILAVPKIMSRFRNSEFLSFVYHQQNISQMAETCRYGYEKNNKQQLNMLYAINGSNRDG